MANVTASMSVPVSVFANQAFTITMTLANAGGSAVTVQHIEASVSQPGGSAQSCSYGMGSAPLGPNNPTSIPAGGPLVISWPCVIYAPQPANSSVLAVPSALQYQLNAVVTTSDVTPVIYSSPQPILVASLIKPQDVSMGAAVAPDTNQGSATFYINGNSGLLALFGM